MLSNKFIINDLTIMNSVINNEYTEIFYQKSGIIICQVWKSSSSHLSELEFLEQLDSLFSTIEVFNLQTLYIDAFDFCYPISEHAMQQIINHFQKCNIYLVGVVSSSNLLGKIQISNLSKKISAAGITITILQSRQDGLIWLDSLIRLYIK